MSLGDPSWELIDPTPNVHNMFVQFDKTFFWSKLESRTTVRWSKRMYSCAGTCAYGGKKFICDIALSEPLLKLRPRKDLVETLLHEMIHAFLFLTGGDRDRDGHGPQFKGHMHRINKQAGLNISIYHTFNEEVKLYLTHWWRCNGPCQHRHPYFGTIRRSANRAPGPKDYWWEDHKKRCNGTFIKIKEPQKKTKKSEPTKQSVGSDMSKFVNKTTDRSKVINSTSNVKTISAPKGGANTKLNGNTVVITKKKTNNNECPSKSPPKPVNKHKPINTIDLWAGKGQKMDNKKVNINNVNETVRNIWANKQLNSSNPIQQSDSNNNSNTVAKTTNKRHSISDFNAPPAKITKIDNTNQEKPNEHVPIDRMTSLINDIYGEAFKLLQENGKYYAIKNTDLVNCPICNEKFTHAKLNGHVDDCLSKEEIARIAKEEYNKEVNSIVIDINKPSTSNHSFDNFVKPCVPKLSDGASTCHQTNVIDLTDDSEKKCPCCSQTVNSSMDDHLEVCLSFMDDNTTIPYEEEVRIKTEPKDDVDDFDESQIFNETGTKYPCPCCLTMVEQDDMYDHLDVCLQK